MLCVQNAILTPAVLAVVVVTRGRQQGERNTVELPYGALHVFLSVITLMA